MTQLPKETADVELGGLTAMVKAQSGIVLNECAQCAMLLFGGNGYTKSGQGELIESKMIPLPQLAPDTVPHSLLDTQTRDQSDNKALTIFSGIYREAPGIRIPGGSEDVMMDLGVRQLVKNFKKTTAALQSASKL
jgi:acyl-CoA dehydrogenase